MSYQQEELPNSKDINTETKRPNSLTVLLVLSAIYIVMSLSATFQAISNGPLTQNQLEQETSEFYGSMVELRNQGLGEELTDMAEVMVETSVYINNEVYQLTNYLRLIELIIGAASLVLMFQLKKIGFHIYLFYSLFPIITTYITLPQELILTASIVVMVFIGALFALLYGTKLKYMK
ncbi:hypothetical protein [Brumimicrobium oceani]|uniref:Uncharacterized protein n=1 Tax=Brumimicrobium oceani TaxID=2100725 RepID=A0A2U2XEP5_9FLAO|nr:hypothetical protein [Brumimicrobium oceani]PWH86171.1 hypothetical protein DIT68_06345 [Brumimicrobium oceani]